MPKTFVLNKRGAADPDMLYIGNYDFNKRPTEEQRR